MSIFLGIHYGHNAGATLMIDGKITFCFQEERFNKIKNFIGYPSKSINEIFKYIIKKKLRVDEVGFANVVPRLFTLKFPINHHFTIKEFHKFYGEDFYTKKLKGKNVSAYINKLKKDKRFKKNIFSFVNKEKDLFSNNGKLGRKILSDEITKKFGKYFTNLSFVDHHTCHAYYAKFATEKKEKKKSCIIILDSMGDGLNQTLWLFDPKKNSKILKKILANANCDLARIYKMVTLILNMKPDEHEFKVMGMAPYGKKKYYLKIYKNIFKNIIKFKDLKIVENKRPKDLFIFLKESLKYERFDNIAAACQYFLEKIVNELCFRIYKKYKIKNFYFGGGISMNVKMYKDLASKKYINKIVNSPSGSDESLSLGACYYLNRNNNNKILKDLYLGRKLIQDSKKLYEIAKSKFNKKDFKIINNVKSNYIAQLLKKDEIIAIANGREEFGARALGSRSIIANPSNFENIRKINEYIKSRDFWMPFALSILDEEKNTLLLNVNSLNSSYMNLSFDTKKKYNEKIKAGCHPYDKTVRPQFVKKSQNINYYSIIKNFNKITKIPALLNTSLNLHGSPKCSDLLDVIYTFKNSGLKYLYLENNLLIKKIKIEQLRKETS